MSVDAALQERFLAWYGAEYPAKERLAVTEMRRLSDGWECEVYALSLTYRKGGVQVREDLILRLYQGPDASATATREFGGLRLLADAGYPVPRVDRLAPAPSPVGLPCITMEYIRGQSLMQAIDASSDDERLQHYRRFSRLLFDLHSLDWRPFADTASIQGASAWLSMARSVAEHLRLHTFDPIIDWLEARRYTVASERLAVVHWDFHPENVLLKGDGSAVVIDWTQVGVSDYRFDLAWTLLLAGTFRAPALRRLLLEEYEALAGQPVEHLAFFDVAVCLKRLASFCITLTQGATGLGMRPEAAAQMRRNVPHFQAVYGLLHERTGLRLPELERLLDAAG